jgi:hypothetical protein
MEYEELQSIWKAYDQKLDRLEKLNKKLVAETLAQKPQKKINRWMFRNIYGMLAAPIVLTFVLFTQFKAENINIGFILGCTIILFVMINLMYIYYRGYASLRKINLLTDPVIESVKKVNEFKTILWGKMNYNYLLSLLLLVGIFLTIWEGLHFNGRTIGFLIAFLAVMIFWTSKKSRMHINNLEKLKKDILDLEEYQN